MGGRAPVCPAARLPAENWNSTWSLRMPCDARRPVGAAGDPWRTARRRQRRPWRGAWPHRVQHVHVDAAAVQRVVVQAVQRQAGLVQAVQVPGRTRLHADHGRALLHLQPRVRVHARHARVPRQRRALAGVQLRAQPPQVRPGQSQLQHWTGAGCRGARAHRRGGAVEDVAVRVRALQLRAERVQVGGRGAADELHQEPARARVGRCSCKRVRGRLSCSGSKRACPGEAPEAGAAAPACANVRPGRCQPASSPVCLRTGGPVAPGRGAHAASRA